jgi:hypothetical protein
MDKRQRDALIDKDIFINNICELCRHALDSWVNLINHKDEKGDEQIFRAKAKQHNMEMLNMRNFLVDAGILNDIDTKSISKRKKSMKKGEK